MDIDLWTEKHRPHTLSDIVGQGVIIKRLVKFVENRTVPHCLFAGPPGTAKTTAGMAMARDLFGNEFAHNFMELNASDERGIDVVRKRIKNFARTIPTGNAPFKILILDEADHLTSDAQHALRRTMETYAVSCRIILICNYSSRIIPPIQSRCAVFKFTRLSDSVIANRLGYIIKQEKVKVNEGGKKAILYIAEGDMRSAINLLQVSSSTEDIVTSEIVFSISGHADPEKVRNMLIASTNGKYDESLDFLRNLLYQQGVSSVDLVRQIHREILGLNVTEQRKMQILERNAEVEFRITEGAQGEIQLASLLAFIGLE